MEYLLRLLLSVVGLPINLRTIAHRDETLKMTFAPKLARSLVYRSLGPLYLERLRRRGASIGAGVSLYGFPEVSLKVNSHLEIGDRVVLCSDSDFTALALSAPIKISTITEEAKIAIGNDTGLSGTCIVCARSISIGSEVLIGANVMIVDTDFHPIAPENRRHSDDPQAIGVSPVVVGNNVFIGAGSIVLKGASIGHDSVVGAGSVVPAGTFPKGAIIGGNPARVIGSVYER